MAQRVQYILIGLLGGLAFWALSEAPEAWRGARFFVAAVVLAVSFFSGALAMLGELKLRRAVGFAAAIGAVAGVLVLAKSLNFTSATQMLDAGHVLVALVAVTFLPVPFAIAYGLGGRAGWADYRVLFIESWNIVVRYAAAWLFVGLVWGVLWLLAMLLRIVGVEVMADLLSEPLVVWLVVGGALGLGLSVVTEMSDMVSPYLLLRLLRLLAPLVLGVVVIFILALPLRGLTHLFGHLSAAAILMATALAGVALISIAVDQDDVEAVHGPVLAWSGRGLALVLPVLAGLAIWAIALRVGRYGWTPDRVLAATGAAVVAAYALSYAGAVLSGRRWMARIRRANVGVALAMIALGLLWLTPLLSPEGIAARSQMARFAAGQSGAEELPLWEMAHDWGVAGARAVERLRAQAGAPGQEALAARLAQLDGASARWEMDHTAVAQAPERAEALRPVIAVRPEGEVLPEALLVAIAEEADESWAAECARPTPGGNPGCVLVVEDFLPMLPGREAVLLRAGRGQAALAFAESGERWLSRSVIFAGSGPRGDGAALIDAVLAAGGTPVPAGIAALPAGDWKIFPQP